MFISGVDFLKTDVTVWRELLQLFKLAKTKYGHVDIVFANAGIVELTNPFEDTFDNEGELAEPSLAVIDINLKSVITSEFVNGRENG